MMEGEYPEEKDAPSTETLKKMRIKLKDAVQKVEPVWRPIQSMNNYMMANEFKKILGSVDEFKKSMVLPKGEKQGAKLTVKQQEKYNEMLEQIQRFAWHMTGDISNVDAVRVEMEN